MSLVIGNYNKIRSIVDLCPMLRLWSKNAASSHSTADVPSGHVPICVGINRRRFIVRATYLNHPIFQKLLIKAEEEFGFAYQGPLTVPCDESMFEEILQFVSWTVGSRLVNLEHFQRCYNVDYGTNIGEFWPLLRRVLLNSTYK